MSGKSIDQWAQDNPIDDNLIWKKAGEHQFEEFKALETVLGAEVRVVSSHRSKSVNLPVVEVVRGPLRIRSRDNFHDCKVSVEWDKPIDHDFWNLCSSGDLASVYFEGFRDEWCFDRFYRGCQRFSSSIWSGGEGIKLLCEMLVHVLFDGPKPEHKHITYVEEARKAAMEAEAPFPCTYRKDSISGFFYFFDPGHEVAFPSWGTVEDHIRWTKESEWKLEKNPDLPPKLLPYITLYFSAGCPQPVDNWLSRMHELVGRLRAQEGVDRLGDHVGSSVHVQGLSPALRDRCEALKLDHLLTTEKR